MINFNVNTYIAIPSVLTYKYKKSSSQLKKYRHGNVRPLRSMLTCSVWFAYNHFTSKNMKTHGWLQIQYFLCPRSKKNAAYHSWQSSTRLRYKNLFGLTSTHVWLEIAAKTLRQWMPFKAMPPTNSHVLVICPCSISRSQMAPAGCHVAPGAVTWPCEQGVPEAQGGTALRICSRPPRVCFHPRHLGSDRDAASNNGGTAKTGVLSPAPAGHPIT